MIDQELMQKWSINKELLINLLKSEAFNSYQAMIKDCIDNLLKFGLDINSSNREEDIDAINIKRGALNTYYYILDLPSAVLSQLQEQEESKQQEAKGDVNE